MFKIVLAVIITAVVVGGGVYYWQQNEAPTTPTPVSTDLFDMAKNSTNEFTYLVSAPKVDGDWKMILNDSYLGKFSLEYNYPWNELRYKSQDFKQVGMPGEGFTMKAIPGVKSYLFCAGMYYCDEYQRTGMGFELKFWDAEYLGREDNPQFYLEDGDILIKETDKYIITYKPFYKLDPVSGHADIEFGAEDNVRKEVEEVVSTFKFY
jgi:hypothetical protein